MRVKINEVMVRNSRTIADDAGAYPPWVELFNPTDAPVDLSGVPLSDDLGQVSKWAIPSAPEAVIPPRGYLVVFCDGDAGGAGGFHASFALEPGFLQLVLNKGSDFFFFDSSGLEPDQSAGRHPDGGSAISVLSAPTPGAVNEEPPLAPEAMFIRGDANGDGRVNVSDMTKVLGFLFGSSPEPRCADGLDADDSGEVNLSDALFIGHALYRQGPPFPSPFPDYGRDPTLDELGACASLPVCP